MVGKTDIRVKKHKTGITESIRSEIVPVPHDLPPWNPVDPERAKRFVDAARAA
jgi:hypothetical protein